MQAMGMGAFLVPIWWVQVDCSVRPISFPFIVWPVPTPEPTNLHGDLQFSIYFYQELTSWGNLSGHKANYQLKAEIWRQATKASRPYFQQGWPN